LETLFDYDLRASSKIAIQGLKELDVQRKNSAPLSTGKGAALIAAILLPLLIAGFIVFAGFSLSTTSTSYRNQWRLPFEQNQDYNRAVGINWERKQLYIGIAVVLITAAMYGLLSGMIFGQGAWLFALILTVILEMIVVPLGHNEWATYTTGLSFRAGYVAAVLGPLIAASMAHGVSRVRLDHGWAGIQLDNPYVSVLIGCLPYFILASIAFAVLQSSLHVPPRLPNSEQSRQETSEDNIRIKIRAQPTVVYQGGTIKVSLDVNCSRTAHTSYYFPEDKGGQFLVQKYGQEVWRYPAAEYPGVSQPAGQTRSWVLLDPGERMTFSAEWNTSSTQAGQYVIQGSSAVLPSAVDTVKVEILNR
jgi:hypothetical protein